jgi:hypothetical protein
MILFRNFLKSIVLGAPSKRGWISFRSSNIKMPIAVYNCDGQSMRLVIIIIIIKTCSTQFS